MRTVPSSHSQWFVVFRRTADSGGKYCYTTRGVRNSEKSVRGCISPDSFSLRGYQRSCQKSKMTDAENGPVHMGTRAHFWRERCGHVIYACMKCGCEESADANLKNPNTCIDKGA